MNALLITSEAGGRSMAAGREILIRKLDGVPIQERDSFRK
jgi:hypothetical protein